MSSQSGPEVPFYISTVDDNCLLLEVSEKIAASLDQSSEAPMSVTLHYPSKLF